MLVSEIEFFGSVGRQIGSGRIVLTDLDFKISSSFIDAFNRNGLLESAVGRQERIIANRTDQTRNPSGIITDPFYRTPIKQLFPLVPGLLQHELYVAIHLFRLQRRELKPERNPLLESRELYFRKSFFELGLSDQDDLQELFPVSFKI